MANRPDWRLVSCSSRDSDWGRIVFLQQVLHSFQVPRRILESFDLFAQLCLLDLLGAYDFVDILQEKPPSWNFNHAIGEKQRHLHCCGLPR